MQNNVMCAMQSQKVTFDEIELQYSEEHKMYFYPMPEDSPIRLAYGGEDPEATAIAEFAKAVGVQE